MIKILKGDTSADISFALAEGFDYSGATVHVEYQGAVKTFTGCAAGDVLALRFSADETAVMSLGSYPVSVRITNPSGMVKTIQNANTKICVTDDPAEVSGGAIALDVKGTLYGIEDLPERWTEADIVAKLREIMRRGGAVLCALLTFSAFGASVQTARKDAIYNDAQIVTNVTFDGLLTEHQDISGKADRATTYTKQETDARIVELAPPGITTNDVREIVTNEVDGWGEWILAISGELTGEGLEYWRQTVHDATISGHVSIRGNQIWIGEMNATADQDVSQDGTELKFNGAGWGGLSTYFGLYEGDIIATRMRITRNALGLARREDITNTVTKSYVENLGIESGIQEEADPVWLAEKSNYATVQELRAVSNESSVVTRLFMASNVIDEVTNYNSVVRIPSRRLYQLTESNTYVMVWDEMSQHTNTLGKAQTYTDNATGTLAQAVAPRAWSRVTSGLGMEAPSNTTWISTPTTVIAGGYEPSKYITAGGAIWLVTSNGRAYDFSPSTNNTAYLNISAQDGVPMFRIEKTDAYLVGVNATGVTVENGNTLVVNVDIVAADHPLVRVKGELTDATWEKEEDGIPSTLATVAWSGSTGNYTCRITNNTGGSSLFAYFEYLQEGGTKIVNQAAMDVSAGILCTDGIHKVRPVYNNGNITWEVVP